MFGPGAVAREPAFDKRRDFGAILLDHHLMVVAVDADVLEPTELSVFMPEPGGPTLAELERILRDVAGRTNVLGAGLTGLTFEPSNVQPLSRVTAALGLQASPV